MKRPLFLIISCCLAGQANAVSDFLLQNYYAGLVSVDMTPAEAAAKYPSHRVKQWEPYPRVNVIDIDPTSGEGGAPGMRLNLDLDKKSIWLISILDKRYKTAKGIGIGSTYGDLRKAHPQLDLRFEAGEMDRFIVAEIKGEGIAFQLQYNDAIWKKTAIPDTTLVQSIAVHRRH